MKDYGRLIVITDFCELLLAPKRMYLFSGILKVLGEDIKAQILLCIKKEKSLIWQYFMHE